MGPKMTIHGLKEGQPCSSGQAMLQSQLHILNEPDMTPFNCTSSDVKEAYPPTLLVLDSDLKGDIEIE